MKFIKLVTIFLLLITSVANSKPVTWFNYSYPGAEESYWHLSILPEDLPKNSLCLFDQRVFEPASAIKEASCWLNKSGFKPDLFRAQDVKIHTLGDNWKQCVYIVHLRNDKKEFSMYVGVDFDGNVYRPFKMPMTKENLENKEIDKCLK